MTSTGRRHQQAEATRELLLDRAREVFADSGFQQASIDQIAARAGLTKGAVYHHFAGKKALFAACYEQQLQRMTTAIEAVPGYPAHPWQSAMNRCRAFLDFGRRQQGATIALQEAIPVLGWRQWRRLDQQYSMGLVRSSIDELRAAGLIATDNPALIAELVYSMLVGAAMEIAASADPRRTREQAMAAIAAMLGGLRPA